MSLDIYTIGHSTHDLQHFIGLLKLHEIKVAADVRQSPYSGIVPHFNRETLKNILLSQQIQYVFLGNLLGARPTDPACYRDGKVDFDMFKSKTEILADAYRQFGRRIAVKEEEHDHMNLTLCVQESGSLCK